MIDAPYRNPNTQTHQYIVIYLNTCSDNYPQEQLNTGTKEGFKLAHSHLDNNNTLIIMEKELPL